MRLRYRLKMMLAILSVAFGCVAILTVYNYRVSLHAIEQQELTAMFSSIKLQGERFDTVMQAVYLQSRELGSDQALCEQVQSYLHSEKNRRISFVCLPICEDA